MKTLTTIITGIIVTLSGISAAMPCSMFTAHDSQSVLVAQNEDYYYEGYQYGLKTKMWFVPASGVDYGYVAWGYDNNFAQGGMNDQGLFWDGFWTPAKTPDATGTETFALGTLEDMMKASATVDEAIAFLREYDLRTTATNALWMFVDANGDSAIFEGDLAFYPTENYQVTTNWLPSAPELGAYPCSRYATAMGMMQNGLELTVDYFADVADAVHQGSLGTDIYTRYTTISDLTTGTFYLYYDLNYDDPIEFVLADELAQGAHEVYMGDLFPPRPDPEPIPDAGVVETPDAAVDTPDAGGNTSCDNDSGGCSAAGSSSPVGNYLLGLMFLLLVLRRRRRNS